MTIENMFAILCLSLLRELDTARQCECHKTLSIILALRRRDKWKYTLHVHAVITNDYLMQKTPQTELLKSNAPDVNQL